MNFKHLSFLCLAALPLMALTCDRDNDTPAPAAAASLSMGEFMVKNRSPKQVFTVNSQNAIHIVGGQGIQVDIAPNTITTQSGMPVTGNVQVQLIEIFKKKDMVLHQMPTNSNYGGMLKSQGEIYLNVSQNGTNLLAPATIKVPATAASPNPTSIFTAPTPLNDSIGQAPPWSPVDDSSQINSGLPFTVGLSNNSNNWFYELQMNVSGLFWTNLDIFWPNGTMNSMQTTGSYISPSGTTPIIYLVMDGFQSAGKLFANSSDRSFTSAMYSIPNGQAAKIIAMQFENGKFYFGKTAVTTGPGITPQVNLQEVSEAKLVTELNAL